MNLHAHLRVALCISFLLLLPFAQSRGQASLPTSYSGVSNWSTGALPVNWSSSLATGDTYSGSLDGSGTLYARFGTQGDNLVIYFSGTPGTLTYYLKLNGSSTPYQYDVLESGNGTSYTTVRSHTNTSNAISTTGTTAWTATLSSTTQYLKFVYTTKPSGTIVGLDGVSIASGGPQLLVSPASLSGFSTTTGTASAAQSFGLSGNLLTGAPGNITATAPANFEISLSSGSGYSSSVSVPYTGATLSATTLYARITAGASSGTASGNVTFSGGGAPSAPTVALSGSVACIAPSAQAVAGTASAISGAGATLNWTRGNGSNVLVVARGSATTAVTPSSGTSYTANTAFGSGATTGMGNYVVYNGSGTGVAITGLSAVTGYMYDVYEYNTVSTCYNTTASSSAAFTTLCVYPAQAAGSSVSGIGTTTANIGFTAGGGSNRLVLVKAGATVTDVPVDGTSYSGNNSYSGASLLGASRIVSSSASTSINITSLSAGTTYSYAVYEYNSGTKCYQTAGAPAGSFTTAANSSDIVSAGGEAGVISSLSNGTISSNTDGTHVWSFTIRDGGGVADGDALPTIVTGLNLSRINTGSPVADWSVTIADAAIFDGVSSTPVAHASTITATQLQFTSLNLSIPDDGNTTYTLRISLKSTLGATDDGRSFVFSVSGSNFTTAGTATSSQKSGSFPAAQSATATGTNIIDVSATKLVFTQQPTSGGANQAMQPAVAVAATDVNGNTDLGFAGTVSVTSTGTLSGSPVSIAAVNGIATFAGLTHTAAGTGLTLNAAGTGITAATSAAFNEYIVTIFRGGDIAIVAVNTNASRTTPASANDEISIVPFVAVTPGTSFFLTDNGYERSLAGKWGTNEGVLQLSRLNTPVPAGRVFTLVTDASGNIHFYICGMNDDANWTVSYVNGMGASFDLSSTDQLWLAQSGTWTPGGTAQQAVFTGTVLYGWTGSGWQTSPGYASASGSTIVPGAACFITNITGSATKFNYAANSSAKDEYGWISAINQGGNWTAYSSNTNFNSGGTDFLGNTACVDFSLNSNTAANGVWTGMTGNHNWFDCINWQTMKVPDSNTDVTISNAAQYTEIKNTAASAALYGAKAYAANLSIAAGNNLLFTGTNGLDALQVNGNLTIANTGTINLSAATITVKGNIDNQSAVSNWVAGTGSTLVFAGAAAQTVSASGAGIGAPLQAYNLKLAKSGGDVTLAAPLRVSGTATFTNGIVNASSGSPLMMADNATAAGASAASYVSGPVRKTGDDAFIFPTGKGGVYRPASITAPASVTDVFTAEYFRNGYATRSVTAASGLDHVSALEYWDIAHTAGTGSVDLTLFFGPGSYVDAGLLSTLRLAHYNGSTWDNLGVTGYTSTSVTKSGVSAFSPFTLGTTSSAQPLPLRLTAFGGAPTPGGLQLFWRSACETGMSGYEVQQSPDARSFRTIGKVAARNEGCASESAYSFTDAAFSRNAAYRLRMTAADGMVTFGPVHMFHNGIMAADVLSISPNPAGALLHVSGIGAAGNWRITDAFGRSILCGVAADGEADIKVDELAAGIYFLRAGDGQAARFVKE